MKKLKRRNVSEESYWKSSTDIMAGVLLVILLVLMLLLLLLSQMKKEEHQYDDAGYYVEDNIGEYDVQPTTYEYHLYDGSYMEPPDDGGGGGDGGSGEDDPGLEIPQEVNPDEGHDKCAVFVTIIDEETGNAIKKEGVLFELYADKNGNGGLQTLHTYYPTKVEYKQFKTTKDGTFYLPEKITNGWYSFHNLTPPDGYGTADDFAFEITESLDWPEPYLVQIPFSPSKNNIFVTNIDADTKQQVGGEVYEVYAAEDIVTLDGTVRFKSGQKVDEFKCDAQGNGSSKKLYLGKYYLSQKTSAQYYARNLSKIDAQVKLTDTQKNAVVVECTKTQIDLTLKDEYSGAAIKDAVYTVTDKGDLKTNAEGKIHISDLDKDKIYSATLKSLPEPYRVSSKDPINFSVDKDGNIAGEAKVTSDQTAYMIRLSVDVKDIIFKNSVASTSFDLYNSNDELVAGWDSEGEPHIIEGLEPGSYTLDIRGHSTVNINLKDNASLQKSETYIWTLWDTILTITGVIVFALMIYLLIRFIRFRRRKKKDNNEQQKDTVEKK